MGNEFKGEVAKYFDKLEVNMRVANRGRQQGLVERANQSIDTALTKRMVAQELLTGEPSSEWVSDLKTIINSMNKTAEKFKHPPEPKDPISEPSSKNILAIGTIVRVQLDEPVEVTSIKDKRLHGKFRAGDIKFNQKI